MTFAQYDDSPLGRLLLTADFLVSAGESGYAWPVIENFRECVFRTAAGVQLLDAYT